jgi:hypothetical protein
MLLCPNILTTIGGNGCSMQITHLLNLTASCVLISERSIKLPELRQALSDRRDF